MCTSSSCVRRTRRISNSFALLAPLFVILASSSIAQPAPMDAPLPGDRLDSRTVLGEVVPFGEGTARTWVRLDQADKPTALGMTLTEAALEGLPARTTPGLIWMVEYVAKFPSDIPLLPFNHAGVNWNPHGHPPNDIYGIPHFDFHFYMISPEQRNLITARGEDIEKCQRVPAAGTLPESYVYALGAEEPGMGGHWVDPNSHEFHGQTFTSSFIYGTHDGEIIFWEPMITKAYLEERPDVTIPLSVPARYSKTGYYPTSYSITFDENRREYTVSLDGLTLREASPPKPVRGTE